MLPERKKSLTRYGRAGLCLRDILTSFNSIPNKRVVMNDFEKFRKEMIAALKNEFGEFACPIWGNQNARIVSISQAPSLSVIRNQRPFSDKSGERLRNEWYCVSDDVFYNPANFYFTAVGMYFPGKDGKGGDKKPSYEWAEKWLRKELTFLNPKLFLLVGSVSAGFFFPGRNFKELVFEDQRLNGASAFVLPHPSPINIKWFKDNPKFENERLPEFKRRIQSVLCV